MAESRAKRQAEQGDEPVATMSYVKRIVRKNLRRAPEFEEQFLNIYPMMDMMTILVVFLLMQFAASSAASLQESKFLRIPYSTSQEKIEEALPIRVAYNVIMVENDVAVELRDGIVDPSHKLGGGQGFVITPLLKKVEERAQLAKALSAKAQGSGYAFQQAVLLAVDECVPYRTVMEVLQTVGQVGYKNIRFVVDTKR